MLSVDGDGTGTGGVNGEFYGIGAGVLVLMFCNFCVLLLHKFVPQP